MVNSSSAVVFLLLPVKINKCSMDRIQRKSYKCIYYVDQAAMTFQVPRSRLHGLPNLWFFAQSFNRPARQSMANGKSIRIKGSEYYSLWKCDFSWLTSYSCRCFDRPSTYRSATFELKFYIDIPSDLFCAFSQIRQKYFY